MATAVEELRGLLLAATGEESTRGRLGHWRVRVNELLGEVAAAVGIGAGGSSAFPDFGWKRRTGDQAAVGAGVNIDFNTDGSSRGLQAGGNPNSFVLNLGKRYRLSAAVNFNTFSDVAAGFIRLQFVDDTNTPLMDGGAESPEMDHRPTTSTDPSTSSAPLEMIYTVPTSATPQQRVVKVRCVAATGTATVVQSQASFMVEEIPGGV